MTPDWKFSHCGQCEFWIPGERPRQLIQGQAGVLMDGPRAGVCREHIETIGYLAPQPGGQLAMVCQAVYPPCNDQNPACSRFVRALALVETE